MITLRALVRNVDILLFPVHYDVSKIMDIYEWDDYNFFHLAYFQDRLQVRLDSNSRTLRYGISEQGNMIELEDRYIKILENREFIFDVWDDNTIVFRSFTQPCINPKYVLTSTGYCRLDRGVEAFQSQLRVRSETLKERLARTMGI